VGGGCSDPGGSRSHILHDRVQGWVRTDTAKFRTLALLDLTRRKGIEDHQVKFDHFRPNGKISDFTVITTDSPSVANFFLESSRPMREYEGMSAEKKEQIRKWNAEAEDMLWAGSYETGWRKVKFERFRTSVENTQELLINTAREAVDQADKRKLIQAGSSSEYRINWKDCSIVQIPPQKNVSPDTMIAFEWDLGNAKCLVYVDHSIYEALLQSWSPAWKVCLGLDPPAWPRPWAKGGGKGRADHQGDVDMEGGASAAAPADPGQGKGGKKGGKQDKGSTTGDKGKGKKGGDKGNKGKGAGKGLPGKPGGPIRASGDATRNPFQIYLVRVLSWRADSSIPAATGDRVSVTEEMEEGARLKRARHGREDDEHSLT
jgi:hypothetical protein